MEILSTLILFCFSIFVLVTVHEYGHFLVARINNVKVIEFSIGIGKPLFSYLGKKGTLYQLKILPLGGYIRMLDSKNLNVADEKIENDFNNKHPFQKISIVLAGPIFNLFFAVFCFTLMYHTGILDRQIEIFSIKEGSIASNVGMKSNYSDRYKKVLAKINDIPVRDINDTQDIILKALNSSNKILKLSLKENNKIKNYYINLSKSPLLDKIDLHDELLIEKLGVVLVPNYLKISSIISDDENIKKFLQKDDLLLNFNNKNLNIFEILSFIKNNPNTEVNVNVYKNNKLHDYKIKIDEKNNQGFIGIKFETPFSYSIKSFNYLESFQQSLFDTYNYTKKSFTMIFMIVFGNIGLENIHGPLMVAKVANDSWHYGLSQFLKFLGIISIGLGVINLLPIPILDGGHVIFHLIEWIYPKLITEKFQDVWFRLGICIVVLIFILAIYNDIKYW